MEKLIEYILKKIDNGCAAEDLYVELKVIQKLIKFIPSYEWPEAMSVLLESEVNENA